MYRVIRIGLILALLAVSVYTDHKNGKVLNKITFPAMFCGIVLACFDNGMDGLFDSLMGLGLGLALFILPFMMGLLGAGDVKLLMAVGALAGPGITFQSFLFGSMFGGLMSLFVAMRRGVLLNTLKGMGKVLHMMFWKIFMKVDCIEPISIFGAKNKERAFPYSLAIAVGVIIAFFIKI